MAHFATHTSRLTRTSPQSAEVNGLWATPGTLTANAYLLPFYCTLFVIAPIMAWCMFRANSPQASRH